MSCVPGGRPVSVVGHRVSVAENGLAGEDWLELVQMLQFVRDWLAIADPVVRASFDRFVGAEGYPLEAMVADLDKFGFLLGGNDGEHLLEPPEG